MHAIPGDPLQRGEAPDPELRAAMYEKYGLDKPLWYQYIKTLGDYIQGRLWHLLQQRGLTTNEIIASGFPYSLRIGLYASIIVIVIGISFGLVAALRKNRIVDRVLMFLSTLGATIPTFVFATLFLFVFSHLLAGCPPTASTAGRATSAPQSFWRCSPCPTSCASCAPRCLT